MFRGLSTVSVDAKGRFAIPSKYRGAIVNASGGQMVATVDHSDKCLMLYSLDQWVRVEETLEALPNMNANVRIIQRLILGYADEIEMDGQGRVLLSSELRDYAGLGKKAVLVGQAKRFELWDAQTWEESRDLWVNMNKDKEEVSQILSQVSL